MTSCLLIAASTFSATILLATVSFGQQSLSADDQSRIQLGVDIIKLACGTRNTSENLVIEGTGGASLTLKKAPGFEGGGAVTFTRKQAEGLIAALNDIEPNKETVELQRKQLDCMKPYADRIFDVIFPLKTTEQKNLIPVTVGPLDARAEPPGWKGGKNTAKKPLCLAAPPNHEIVGPVNVERIGTPFGNRGSISEIDYDVDNKGRTIRACVVLEAWSSSKSFGGGGWISAKMSGNVGLI